MVLVEFLLERSAPWTSFPNVDTTCHGTQSFCQDSLCRSQNHVRKLQKHLLISTELYHSRAFTGKTRTECCSALTMAKHSSTHQASQVQAPLGILPYVAQLTAHSTLLTQRTTHFSKVFSTLFWDLLEFDKTHQDTLKPWLTYFKKQSFSFMRSTWRISTGLVSLSSSPCAQHSPHSGKSSSDRISESSITLFLHWGELCKELQSLAQITPGFSTHKQRRVISNPIQVLAGFWKHTAWT